MLSKCELLHHRQKYHHCRMDKYSHHLMGKTPVLHNSNTPITIQTTPFSVAL